MVILSLTPILFLVVMLFWFKWPLTKAAPFAFVYTLLLVLFKWELTLSAFFGLIYKSGFLTFDVLLILFGAIFFLNYLRAADLISPMQNKLGELSQDKTVLAFILAWLFGSFLEGISGFGTPAAIVAPLLVSLGFAPMKAVLLSLLANSTAVTFGAVGTPIRVGFASLDISQVATQAALINLMSGWLVPLMMLVVISESISQFRKGICLALAAGFVFLIPYYLFSHLGFEFPSIFGGAVGLLLALLYLKPKHVKMKSLLAAFTPYLLLIGVLVAGKFIFINFSYVLTLSPELKHSLNLFNPGLSFLTVILFLNFKRPILLKPLALEATRSLQKTALAIFFTSALSYLMILSGLLQTLSNVIISEFLPVLAVFLGAFGSFLAGSATVSNLLFGEIQSLAATKVGISSGLILALQLVGAGVGNMIALSNILAVQAAVGISGQEASILKRLIAPCVIYLFTAGIFGFFLASGK